MPNFGKQIVIILSVLLISGACSIQKKRYLKGFYYSRTYRVAKITSDISDSVVLTKDQKQQANDKSALLTAGGNSIQSLGLLVSEPHAKVEEGAPACDTVILVNGRKIAGRVVEQGTSHLKIRNCEGPGEAITIPKSHVKEIRLHPDRPVLAATNPPEANTGPDHHKKARRLGAWSLVCIPFAALFWVITLYTWSLISFGLLLMLTILSICLAINSIRLYRRSQSKQGIWFAYTTLIIFSLILALFMGVFNFIL